jgi:hypothetical protein
MMPVSANGAVIPILIRASLSIHVQGAAASFAGRPIRIDPGVLGTSLILFARLVCLLGRAVWLHGRALGLNLGCIGRLNLAFSRFGVRLLRRGRDRKDGTGKQEQRRQYVSVSHGPTPRMSSPLSTSRPDHGS